MEYDADRIVVICSELNLWRHGYWTTGYDIPTCEDGMELSGTICMRTISMASAGRSWVDWYWPPDPSLAQRQFFGFYLAVKQLLRRGPVRAVMPLVRHGRTGARLVLPGYSTRANCNPGAHWETVLRRED